MEEPHSPVATAKRGSRQTRDHHAQATPAHPIAQGEHSTARDASLGSGRSARAYARPAAASISQSSSLRMPSARIVSFASSSEPASITARASGALDSYAIVTSK
jgi:hypothetical protein